MTTDEVEAKPEITKAVARGDLTSVRRIVDAAAVISNDEKIKTINYARKWVEHSLAYKSEDNPTGVTEWFDVTPITTAAIRGHDGIVEYLLQQGADPTLKGCPKDDILPNDDGEPLIDLPGLHTNAFDAATKLSRKIRCCRRTQDLLLVIKPYWKKAVYSGSSATRHKRTIFSNLPLGPDNSLSSNKDCHLGWVLDALGEVPKLQEYPLKAKDFNKNIMDSNFLRKRKRVVEDHQKNNANNTNRDGLLHQSSEEAIVYGQGSGRQRRCSSCGELKPEPSYNKNEKKKGVEARCISCVANNPDPGALDLSTICPVCKKPMLNDGDAVCQPCLSRMASDSKKPPPAVKKETE